MTRLLRRLLAALGLRDADRVERARADRLDRRTRQQATDERLDGRGPPFVG